MAHPQKPASKKQLLQMRTSRIVPAEKPDRKCMATHHGGAMPRGWDALFELHHRAG